MTTFYVSADGNDSNDGLSATTAWKTVSKIRGVLGTGAVTLGDVVLFRRGDVFYGSNITPPTPASRDGLTRVTFGAYGSGARPIIDAGKTLNTGANWTEHTTGVWKHRLDATALAANEFGGNKENSSTNVGFIKTDGVLRGIKRWALVDLADPWDFYSDTTHVYVKATANPTTLAASIVVAVEGHVFPVTHRMSIHGLHLRHSGSHGVRGSGANVDIIGCEIESCGGSELAVMPGVRYGNGVEAWIGASDWKVEHNVIHDMYDAGFTIQGTTIDATTGNKWTRINARFNRFYANGWDCEVWNDIGNVAHVGVGNEGGFIDCSFEDNECLSSGISWAPETRVGRDVALVLYMLKLPTEFSYRRNIVFNPRDGFMFSNAPTDPGHPINDLDFVIDENEIHMAAGVPMLWNQSGWSLATFQATYNAQAKGRHYVIANPATSVREAVAYLASVTGSARAAELIKAKGSEETAARVNTLAAQVDAVDAKFVGSGCQVGKTANQAYDSTTGVVAVTWDSEWFDTDNYHSNTVNPSRMTAPTAGLYSIGTTIELDGLTAGSWAILRVFKNGTEEFGRSRLVGDGGAASIAMSGRPVQLAAGGYVEFRLETNDVTPRNVRPSSGGSAAWIARIGR